MLITLATRTPSFALLFLISALAPHVSAQQVFIPEGSAGDWFDPASWSLSRVPGPSDDSLVNSFATARASTDSPFFPAADSLIEGNIISIGRAAIANTTGGELLSRDVGLTATELCIACSGGGSATGFAHFGADVTVTSGLQVGEVVSISGLPAPDSSAQGELQVEGSLTLQVLPELVGPPTKSLSIGVAIGGGTQAQGLATISGDVEGSAIRVGHAAGGGAASGELDVGGNLSGGLFRMVPLPPSPTELLVTGRLSLGVTEGLGYAEGTARIGGNLIRSRFEVGRASASGGGQALGNLAVAGSILESYGGDVGVVDVATGKANGSATVAGDAVVQSLRVGSASGDSAQARGELQIGGNLDVSTRVAVGYASSGAHSAIGHLDVRSVRAGWIVIGVTDNAGTQMSSAKGSMSVSNAGVLDPSEIGDLLWVGVTSGSGDAHGLLDFTGDVSGITEARVGAVTDQSALARGTATGELRLHESTFSARELAIGVNAAMGTALGRLVLDRSLVVLDESLTLGEGSTLAIDLEGVLRGTEFGAIDTGTALLDGKLELAFKGDAVPSIYDLIVSRGMDNISGAFAAVTTTGIDSSLVSFGTEVTSIGGELVEVFRVRVVPEPSTAALVALGLIMTLWSRRRER